ncbi:MAG: hypothetical protein AAGI24_01570 [Pseudomonadota bacterium]
MNIGIEDDVNLVYEGRTNYGRAVWPGYTPTPSAVVDKCREAAAAAISGYIQKENAGFKPKDLGDLAKEIAAKPHEKLLVSNAAWILARLHSRTKSAETLSKGLPPPTDEDAELSLHCLSSILRELDFAVG